MDIGAELFAMSAACVRARAERDDRPEGVELADLFCRQARLRVDALFTALWDNTDAVDAAAAKRVLAGRYAFLEEGVRHPDRRAALGGPLGAGPVHRRGRPPPHPAAKPSTLPLDAGRRAVSGRPPRPALPPGSGR